MGNRKSGFVFGIYTDGFLGALSGIILFTIKQFKNCFWYYFENHRYLATFTK